MAIKRPKGTYDLLPAGSPKMETHQNMATHQHLLETAQRILAQAGALQIETPLFEEADLVKRGVGDSSDIVRKEMFTVYYFGDHGGYVLRPEGTAPIMRAYLENGLKQLPTPLKLWTAGPMFRAERHQKGRYRQFFQVDYEALGSSEPLVDAEAIALMVQIVQALGLKQVRVKLGSVGDPTDRQAYNDYLRQTFTPHLQRLSEDSQQRLERNPMRVLDSKNKDDQSLIAELKVRPMLDFLGDEAKTHLQKIEQYLQDWGVTYELDASIVRGLDYYCRTAWELHHEGVGAKSALGGGGRYDGLSEQLGGAATAGIGWAFGVERLLIAMEDEGIVVPQQQGPLLYLAALDTEQVAYAAKLSLGMRPHLRAEFAYRAVKAGNALRDAERRDAAWVGLIGSDEIASGKLTLKHLPTGQKHELILRHSNGEEIAAEALAETLLSLNVT